MMPERTVRGLTDIDGGICARSECFCHVFGAAIGTLEGVDDVDEDVRRRVLARLLLWESWLHNLQGLIARRPSLDFHMQTSPRSFTSLPSTTMAAEGANAAEQCPVDHETREAWLRAARAKGQAAPPPGMPPSLPSTTPQRSRWSLDHGHWQSAAALPSVSPASQPKRPKMYNLSKDREISTIPRAVMEPSQLNSAERAALPANNEADTGHDRESGNWIYPSQEMFFNAMQRKGHSANPSDMQSIVPIHNAVNERAWSEIKAWERGWGSERCGGPKLISFAGDSKALTPKARWKGLLGYTEPFDRHDWVVDRCGKQVEYVIDFYKGRGDNPLSFHLDVRPKINSWEGVKMRIARTVGF